MKRANDRGAVCTSVCASAGDKKVRTLYADELQLALCRVGDPEKVVLVKQTCAMAALPTLDGLKVGRRGRSTGRESRRGHWYLSKINQVGRLPRETLLAKY